jgi:hypothetical protein
VEGSKRLIHQFRPGIERFLAVACALLACASSIVYADSSHYSRPQVPPDSYLLLFIGNSHSAANGLPDLVASMIEAGLPGRSVEVELAPGIGFLSDRLEDGVTREALERRAWSHVILQGQKYSMSGNYGYPTHAAEEWIRRVKAQNARPFLFSEWALEGNRHEGPRIHELHLDIASREPACVAPVGLAWDEAIRSYPSLDLYAADGNHSNINGATLTAFVFYQVITGQPASGLPDLPGIGVSDAVQQQLREAATSVIKQKKPSSAPVRSSYHKRKFRHSKFDLNSPWCH